MSNQRGGAISGLLAAIGLMVVLMAVIFAVCMSNASGQPRSLAPISYRGDDGDCWDYGDCDDGGSYGGYHGDYGGGGNGNRGRKGDNQRGDKNCHSFCGNTIIVPTPPGMGGGQQPQSVTCMVPVPFHCDPKPDETTTTTTPLLTHHADPFPAGTGPSPVLPVPLTTLPETS